MFILTVLNDPTLSLDEAMDNASIAYKLMRARRKTLGLSGKSERFGMVITGIERSEQKLLSGGEYINNMVDQFSERCQVPIGNYPAV